jgi:hypothetical protein
MLDDFISKTMPPKNDINSSSFFSEDKVTNCKELECIECTTDVIDTDKCDHSVD